MEGAAPAKKPLKIVPSDLFPAVRRFLDEGELKKTRKAFDAETCGEDEAAASGKKSKKAKALEDLDLTTACQRRHKKIVAADIVPVLRRFFTEGGLAKTLKAFGKERPEEEAEEGVPAGKKARVLAELELTDVCQSWLAEQLPTATAINGVGKEETKRRHNDEPEATPETEEAEPPKKKRNKEVRPEAAGKAEETSPEASTEAAPPEKKKGKNKKGKEDRPPPVPFKRIDDDKCRALIKDSRLMDNTHKAKQKFGTSAGDSWADKAAEDLLKTRGKGFRKEMAKKKRASWRGGGSIDQGVNSIKFEDSSDDE